MEIDSGNQNDEEISDSLPMGPLTCPSTSLQNCLPVFITRDLQCTALDVAAALGSHKSAVSLDTMHPVRLRHYCINDPSKLRHAKHPPKQETENSRFRRFNLPRFDASGYKHEPIPSDGCMRLIELLPGKGKDPIKCTLKTVSIEGSEDSYEAISYVWGNPRDVARIKCNEKRLSITRNLFDALQNVRHPTEQRMLWADAICINQKDDTEKGHQVKRMGKVYENAKRVLVWLGKDDEGIARDCFALIRETIEYLDPEAKRHGDFTNITTLGSSCPISNDRVRWDQVRTLQQLPWFSRTWVVQESGLAKDCILLWGELQMELAAFVALALFAGSTPTLDRFTGGSLMLGRIMNDFLEIQCTYSNLQTWRQSNSIVAQGWKDATDNSQQLIPILRCARDLEASDPRDYVYAFLGSPTARKDDGNLVVEPDYRKTVQQVYLDLADALLENPREAEWVLLNVDHAHEDDVRGRDLPSWVPRWDYGSQGYYIGGPRWWYHAGGAATAFSPRKLDPRRLAVRGFLFDSLAWVSRCLGEDNFGLHGGKWDKHLLSARKPALDHLIEEFLSAVGGSLEVIRDDLLFTLMRGDFGYNNGPDTENIHELRADYEAYTALARRIALGGSLADAHDINPWKFQQRLEFLHNRKLTSTQSGRLGIVPLVTNPGDICCIVRGLSTPLILRKTSGGCYNLVGAAYINGVMAEELMEEGTYQERDIILV